MAAAVAHYFYNNLGFFNAKLVALKKLNITTIAYECYHLIKKKKQLLAAKK